MILAAGRRRLSGVGAAGASKRSPSSPEIEWGPSTVRAELAALEAAGYLTHPHTSAGRVPTDSGYRHYVDLLMGSGRAAGGAAGANSALAAAPGDRRGDAGDDGGAGRGHRPGGDGRRRRRRASRRRSTGSRSCRCSRTGWWRSRSPRPATSPAASSSSTGPVDPGLVEWASSYLNESLSGLGVGARMIADRLADPELDRLEADFVATLGGAFTESRAEDGDTSTWRRLAAALRGPPRRPAARG